MPTYSFQDINTGEVHDRIMSWKRRCEYLEENPHLKSVMTGAPGIVAGVGSIKNDDGWKENLSRIAEAHPGSEIAKQHGKKDAKTVKSREVVEKWKKKSGGVS